MPLSGKEIHRRYDEFGAIRILDDGHKRYLAFGDEDEQSCWLKSQPLLPQHDYTRAMLLALLFHKPTSMLTLGLGAGSLNSCLRAQLPDLQQQIVELRPGVVHCAYKYFQLPRTPNIQVITMDAFDYLKESAEPQVDMIFSDIYGADGVDEQQLSDNFLRMCHTKLNPHGWLVLNCWKEHKASDSLTHLHALFPDVRACTTSSGNWVIFAGKTTDTQSDRQLSLQAKSLTTALGFSLGPFLNKLVICKN